MKTMIHNVTILTMNQQNQVFQNGYLIFEDDQIIDIGKDTPADFEGRIVDGQKGILMPGMVNTHTHIGMIPFRSLGDDCPDRLRRFLFPLENQCMTKKLACLSGAYAIAEMLLGGVTCMADMYYFEDALVQVAKEMGIRALMGETIINFSCCDSAAPFGGLEIAKRMASQAEDDLIHVMIAPHATNTNPTEILQAVDELSQTYHIPWMMHVSEMDYEIREFEEKYQMTPVAYLDHIGVLSSRLIMAHGIHLTDHDIALMAQHHVSLAHCIGANTKAAKGIAPLAKLRAAGVPVGLGTDGPASGNTLDLFVQMRLLASFHKTWMHDRAAFPAHEIVRMATLGGAEALHLEREIGSLEIGKKADLVILETDAVNMFPIHDPFSAVVYSANASNVRHVFVNGKQLVADKQLTQINLPRLREALADEMTEFNLQAAKASADL